MDAAAERRAAGRRPDGPGLRAVPATRPIAPLRVTLARYLALAGLLVAVVTVLHPGAAEGAPPAPTWSYQRETVDLQGTGVLNIYARAALKSTAWLTRGSIERTRDVARLNLLGFLVGGPAARGIDRWRDDHRLPLESSTKAAMLLLVGYGLLVRPADRGWIVAVVTLLAITLLITKPQATVATATAPSVAVPAASTAVYAVAEPGDSRRGGLSAVQVQQRLATEYWTSFVAQPMSRMQTGTAILEGAPPASKRGVLNYLSGRLASVNDWALGRHGIERAFIATSALLYTLPFAVAVAALAMVGTCAQATLFLLLLSGLFVAPLALEPRYRRQLLGYWLLPLLGSAAVLAFSTLVSLAVMRVGNALHASDEFIGMLLTGSLWPVVFFVILRRRAVIRRRRAPRRAAEAGARGGEPQ